MSGRELKRTLIRDTITLAIEIGDAVLDRRAPDTAIRSMRCWQSPAANGSSGARSSMSTGGWWVVSRAAFFRSRAWVHNRVRSLTIDFQNENLIARTGEGEILAVVPDLICIVDAETAEPITTELLRYGLRIEVLGVPAPEALKSEAAMRAVGPGAFGYTEVEFVPLPGYFANKPGAFDLDAALAEPARMRGHEPRAAWSRQIRRSPVNVDQRWQKRPR